MNELDKKGVETNYGYALNTQNFLSVSGDQNVRRTQS